MTCLHQVTIATLPERERAQHTRGTQGEARGYSVDNTVPGAVTSSPFIKNSSLRYRCLCLLSASSSNHPLCTWGPVSAVCCPRPCIGYCLLVLMGTSVCCLEARPVYHQRDGGQSTRLAPLPLLRRLLTNMYVGRDASLQPRFAAAPSVFGVPVRSKGSPADAEKGRLEAHVPWVLDKLVLQVCTMVWGS